MLLAVIALGAIVAIRTVSGAIARGAQQEGDRIAALASTSAPQAGTRAPSTPESPAAARPTQPATDPRVPRGQSPAAVHAWWQSLTPEEREAALQAHPEQIGWLDGVPAADRDRANRLRLTRDLGAAEERKRAIEAELDTLRKSADGARTPALRTGYRIQALTRELEETQTTIDRLSGVERRLAKLGDDGYLLGLDPTGDGMAIIAVGNPDRAQHTAVWVPGLGTDLGKISGDVDRIEALQRQAERLRPNEETSTIMWLGYDAPEVSTSVVTDGRSQDGARALRPFAEGLHATHEGESEHLTAIGHSYGSTVVAESALAGGFQVDDLIVAGSPGLHTDRATNLSADPRHVWVGAAPDDPVASPESHDDWWLLGGPVPRWLGPKLEEGIHGPSPQDPAFGANRYHVDTHGHSDYWNPNSESLNNQAQIVVGNYGAVHTDHGKAPADRP